MKIRPWVKYVFAVAVLVALAISVKQCRDARSKYEGALTEISDSESRFRAFKTKSDNWAASARERIGSLESINRALNGKVDSLASELSIKPKEVEKIVTIYVEGRDSIVLRRDTTTINDTLSIAARPYTYSDKWNSFVAKVEGDAISLDYMVTDSIYLVETKRKGGLFRKGFSEVHAVSMNPKVSIKGLSSLTVLADRPKRFSVGPYVGLDVTGRVSAGIGLQYAIFRF